MVERCRIPQYILRNTIQNVIYGSLCIIFKWINIEASFHNFQCPYLKTNLNLSTIIKAIKIQLKSYFLKLKILIKNITFYHLYIYIYI